MYVELQAMLKNLCEDRVEGRKTVAEFLRAVSHNRHAKMVTNTQYRFHEIPCIAH